MLFFVFESCSFFSRILVFFFCIIQFLSDETRLWFLKPAECFLYLGRTIVTTVVLAEVFLFAGEGRPLVPHLVRLFWNIFETEYKKRERKLKSNDCWRSLDLQTTDMLNFSGTNVQLHVCSGQTQFWENYVFWLNIFGLVG